MERTRLSSTRRTSGRILLAVFDQKERPLGTVLQHKIHLAHQSRVASLQKDCRLLGLLVVPEIRQTIHIDIRLAGISVADDLIPHPHDQVSPVGLKLAIFPFQPLDICQQFGVILRHTTQFLILGRRALIQDLYGTDDEIVSVCLGISPVLQQRQAIQDNAGHDNRDKQYDTEGNDQTVSQLHKNLSYTA